MADEIFTGQSVMIFNKPRKTKSHLRKGQENVKKRRRNTVPCFAIELHFIFLKANFHKILRSMKKKWKFRIVVSICLQKMNKITTVSHNRLP